MNPAIAYPSRCPMRVLACLLAAFSALPVAGAFADDVVVGWINKPDFDVFTIVRKGVDLPKGNIDLLACDVVRLNDVSATVSITLANYQRLLLDSHASAGKLQVPCSEQTPWYGKQLALVKSIVEEATAPGRRVEVITATRGSEEPMPLSIPALGNYNPLLIAGERSLYIAWTGGVAPYSVTVLQADGAIVTSQSDIRGNTVSLPVARFVPGHYALVVKGSDGHGVKENGLTVVDASRLPPPPVALTNASLSRSDGKLMYAYYLEGWGQGEWTLEALQQAASVTPPTPASSDWIQHRFCEVGSVEP